MNPEKTPKTRKTPEKRGISDDINKEIAERTDLYKKAGELASQAAILANEAAGIEHNAKTKLAEASKPLFPDNVTVIPNKDAELKAIQYTHSFIRGASAGIKKSGTRSVTNKKPFFADSNHVNPEKNVVVFRLNEADSSWDDSLSGDGKDVWFLLEVPFDQLEMVEITELEQEPTT